MERIGVLLVAGLLALAAGGCVFEGGAADEYRCHGGGCPTGLQCVDGICVAAPDAGSDAASEDAALDAPAQEDAAPQEDAQRDAQQDVAEDAPPQEDAQEDAQQDAEQQDAEQQDAQQDAEQQDAQQDAPPQEDAQHDASAGCVLDPLINDAGHFTTVLATIPTDSWQPGATGYTQSVANGLHDTWVSGLGGDHVSIQVVTVLTGQGQPQFDSPNGNFANFAGVIVRASALTTSWQTGYFCGVDVKGQRLLLGRMSGDFLARQDMTILGESAMTVTLSTAYTVNAEAQGSTITCTSGSQQVVRTDATIATGSVGLFTLAARARFTDAYYCLP